MNRQRLAIYVLAGALAVTIAGASLAYNESEADLTPTEVYEHIGDYNRNNPHLVVSQEEFDDKIEEIEEKIDDVIDAMAHPHTEFTSIATSITDLKNDVTNLKNDVSNLKRDQDDSSSRDSNFELITALDSRGDDEEDRFNRGETIYILGENDSSARDLEWEIRDPDGDRIYSRSPGISQYGDFILNWDIPNDADKGVYQVIVEIDRDEDTINFIVD